MIITVMIPSLEAQLTRIPKEYCFLFLFLIVGYGFTESNYKFVCGT